MRFILPETTATKFEISFTSTITPYSHRFPYKSTYSRPRPSCLLNTNFRINCFIQLQGTGSTLSYIIEQNKVSEQFWKFVSATEAALQPRTDFFFHCYWSWLLLNGNSIWQISDMESDGNEMFVCFSWKTTLKIIANVFVQCLCFIRDSRALDKESCFLK